MSALDLQLDLPCVTGLVADLAERDQIVGGIAADLTAFEVVHVEDLVLRMTVTVLAKVTVSGVSGFLCLGRLFQGQPNEAALCFL